MNIRVNMSDLDFSFKIERYIDSQLWDTIFQIYIAGMWKTKSGLTESVWSWEYNVLW